MKLQVNQKGSWRNVLERIESKDQFIAVCEAVTPLPAVLTNTTFRVIEDDGDVVAYLESNGEWVRK